MLQPTTQVMLKLAMMYARLCPYITLTSNCITKIGHRLRQTLGFVASWQVSFLS